MGTTSGTYAEARMRVYLAIRLCAKVGTGARWARYGCGAVASGGHVRSVDRYRTSTGTAVCISCYAQSVTRVTDLSISQSLPGYPGTYGCKYLSTI